MNLSLYFSSCPNDTFLFDALVHQRIDTEDLTFSVHLADIKELNALAKQQIPDVCKVSFFAYTQLETSYTLLESGSALGFGCGPLLIAKQALSLEELAVSTIAIPGIDTTANLLLHYYLPFRPQIKVMRFDEIMPAVVNGEVSAGVIIHESRFVYPDYGLVCLQDLGAYWESQTHCPIPLGGIIAHRRIGEKRIVQLNRLIHNSVKYAFEHPNASSDYVRQNAQELNEQVTKAHIELYVNSFSLDLGKIGHQAIDKLRSVARKISTKLAD